MSLELSNAQAHAEKTTNHQPVGEGMGRGGGQWTKVPKSLG